MAWNDDMRAVSAAIDNTRRGPQQEQGPPPLSQREINDLLRQWKEGTISPDEALNVFRSRRDQGRELQELDASEVLRGSSPPIDLYGPRPPPLVVPPINKRRINQPNPWDY